MTLESRTRWFALYTLTLASLMIVLDATIVNVALPSIRQDLHFSQTSLAWVVNAYLLTYGGFLLLGGRLGDLFGHRRLFLAGITLFTAAPLACGLSTTQGMLIDARSVHGLLGGSLALFGVFLWLETHVAAPLVPLGLFRLRNVAVANGVGVLWAAAMFAWFFLAALYLQLVLGYSPLEVGLSFLPANLIMGAFSIGLSAKLVMRFGFRKPLATGLLLAAAGLLLFVRAPVDGNFLVDVLPSMILLGFGAGIAFNPVLLAAMSDVEPSESGLASGLVNTSFMMGGALGLAVLASIAASRSHSLRLGGAGELSALTGGYHLAFLVGAAFAAAAAVIGGALLREAEPMAAHEPGHGAAAATETS